MAGARRAGVSVPRPPRLGAQTNEPTPCRDRCQELGPEVTPTVCLATRERLMEPSMRESHLPDQSRRLGTTLRIYVY